jgi:hypothetical protein
MGGQAQSEGNMELQFVRLAALVTDEPEHHPTALAEARALLAHIGTTNGDTSDAAIAELATTVGHDVDVWFGPGQWDGGAVAKAAAKADLLADLLKLHAAMLRRRH